MEAKGIVVVNPRSGNEVFVRRGHTHDRQPARSAGRSREEREMGSLPVQRGRKRHH